MIIYTLNRKLQYRYQGPTTNNTLPRSVYDTFKVRLAQTLSRPVYDKHFEGPYTTNGLLMVLIWRRPVHLVRLILSPLRSHSFSFVLAWVPACGFGFVLVFAFISCFSFLVLL